MEAATLFMAKLFGIYFVVIAIAMLFRKDFIIRAAEEFFQSPGLYFLGGALNILFGTSILLLHPVWVFGWQISLTLLGLLILVRGLAHLFCTEGCRNLQKRMIHGNGYSIVTSLFLIFGLWLSYMGFSS